MAKADISISFIGDKALARKLKRLPLAMQKKAVRPAMVKVAHQVKRDINAAIPVDTGKLKRLGMKVVAPKRSRRAAIGRYVLTPTREELGIPGDSKYYYPAHVELGHRIARHIGRRIGRRIGHRGRQIGGNVPGKPYIRGTMKANRPRYIAFLRREIGRLLLKVARKK